MGNEALRIDGERQELIGVEAGPGLLTRLALVRHGETKWNAEKRFQGRQDLALTPHGLGQAAAAAALLSVEEWDQIVSSPLLRARQTAGEIAAVLGSPVTVEEGFTERFFGDAEGVEMEVARSRWPGEVYPRAESLDEVASRVNASFEELVDRFHGQSVVLVCHAVVIRMFMKRFRGIDPGIVPNGSVEFLEEKDFLTAL